ncbi:MAG: hypothetical protein LBK91_05935 [Synergistaceae bacterium]|nr:hypothetical protein [Synergistaceae bacterium]
MAVGEFTVFAEYEIDDDLSLLLARGEGIPRLGIYNLNNEKKKYVPLSWIEDSSRTLKIKAGRTTKEYRMDVMMEGVASLIAGSADALSLNSLAWRGVQILGDLIHIPKTARSDADLNLIADSKRDTLWYAYTPKRGKWRVRPCFAPTETERNIFDSSLEEGKPWREPALSIENGALPFTMRNASLVREISLVNPARWREFMLPVAKAMLLGFSDWSSAGEHLFGDALWKYLPRQNYRSDDAVTSIASAGKAFMNKIIAYLRLWPMLEKVNSELVTDSTKELAERGMKKRERFDMVAPNLGDRQFRVTRLVDESSSSVAFGISPSTRLPGEQDRIITFTEEDWETCLKACALGGEPDPQYTCNSILAAIETKSWYVRLVECLTWAPGPDGEEANQH